MRSYALVESVELNFRVVNGRFFYCNNSLIFHTYLGGLGGRSEWSLLTPGTAPLWMDNTCLITRSFHHQTPFLYLRHYCNSAFWYQMGQLHHMQIFGVSTHTRDFGRLVLI